MTELLSAVERHWARQGIAHGPPAVIPHLDAFEARYDVRLPPELRTYFARLNGSELGSGGPMDDQLLSFWHLAEVRPLSEECPGVMIPDARWWFVIADWSIWAHAYAVRLSTDADAPAPVVAVYDGCLADVAPSFREFLERYLAGDGDALFPDPPEEWAARHRRAAV